MGDCGIGMGQLSESLTSLIVHAEFGVRTTIKARTATT
jgi:hypothetical protein